MTQQIVFLSGILCDWGLWEIQMDALSDVAECQCISPEGTSIEEMARSVLNQAPDTFILSASSMGGYIGMEMARIAPERIEMLILSNTSARQDHPKQRELRLSTIDELKAGDFDTVVERLVPALVSPERRDDEELLTSIRHMMHRVGPETTLRQQLATLDRPDYRPFLKTLGLRTKVISCGHDRVTLPQHGAEIADLVSGAELQHLPQAGHLSPLETPDAVTHLLRNWLPK